MRCGYDPDVQMYLLAYIEVYVEEFMSTSLESRALEVIPASGYLKWLHYKSIIFSVF